MRRVSRDEWNQPGSPRGPTSDPGSGGNQSRGRTGLARPSVLCHCEEDEY